MKLQSLCSFNSHELCGRKALDFIVRRRPTVGVVCGEPLLDAKKTSSKRMLLFLLRKERIRFV